MTTSLGPAGGIVEVLVAGFGPFLDHRENPAGVLARALALARTGEPAFRALDPLPVVYGEAARRVVLAARAARPHAVVVFGLAARSRRIRVERQAKNVCRARAPDARGRSRAGMPVLPGAPAQLSATLDADALCGALRAEGIAAELSNDAGGYVCNDLYYRLLHEAPVQRAVFVHVPQHIDPTRIAAPVSRSIGRVLTS